MSMKSGINFDLDATSCYDRILASVAAICSQRIGMASNVVNTNSTMLFCARYHLKTKLGISSGYYRHTSETPIHGTGQGSGNSPTIWCFVCSALFDALASKAHGATFASYDGTQELFMPIVGFVDDCTQRVNDFTATHQPNQSALIQIMEKDAALWNDLLWASGGALEQSKCSFHLIQTNWTTDGQPFLKGSTDGTPICMRHAEKITPTPRSLTTRPTKHWDATSTQRTLTPRHGSTLSTRTTT